MVFSLFNSKLFHNSRVPNKCRFPLDYLPIFCQPPELYLDDPLPPIIDLYYSKLRIFFFLIFIRVLGQDKLILCFMFTTLKVLQNKIFITEDISEFNYSFKALTIFTFPF